MKKSLIFWFAAVTCAALFLVGCESPTNGDAGAAGSDGKNVGFINDPNVGAAVLDALFLEGDIVTLGPDVDTVEGVVPAGKKLAVSGETAVGDSSIDGSETLEIEAGGSVEVHKGAALFATYISGTAGGVIGAAGSVYGDGAVVLPYVTDNTWPNPDGYLIYNNSTAPNKAAGSVTDGDAPPATLGAADITGLLNTVSQVTVYGLPAINNVTIPAGGKLYLSGSGNTMTGTFNLAATGAELIVKEGASLTASSGITIAATSGANIKVNGTLALASGSSGLTIGENVDLSGATINGSNSAAATLTLPAAITAVRAVTAGPSGLTIDGPPALTVNRISGSGVKSTTIKTYALSGGGSVGLGTAANTFVVKQASIVGGDTEFVLGDAEVPIGSTLTIAENTVLRAGAAGISISAVGNYPLTTANLAKLEGPVTYAGAVTGTANQELSIPENVDVTVSTGTLENITGLTVAEGASLSGDALTLAALTTLEVNGELTLGDTVAVSANLDSAKVSGTGALTLGNTDFSVAKYAALLNITNVTSAAPTLSAAFTVNNTLTLTGTVASSPNVTVSATGTLTVTGSLAVTGANTIVVGGATDKVTLTKATITGTGGATLTGATGTVTLAASDTLVLADGGAITTAGDGKVTAGTTFELGGVGTWTAGTDTVTFAGAADNTGTITGGTSATLTATGDSPTLKLLAESNAQALTIGGTTKFTLDLSTAGSITFDSTTTGSTITLTANTDGIKLSENLAIVGTATAGTNFTGAIVDGTGTFDAATLNVSLIDGVIKNNGNSGNVAAPAAIDKDTTAASLASSDS